MARLVLKLESQVLREIPVSARLLTIGRAPDNDVQIANSDISDHHARITTEEGKVVIEDLNSLNGTFVNDLRVTRTTLRDGDNIRIGEYLLLLDTVHEASTTVADSLSEARKLRSTETAVGPVIDFMHAPTLLVMRGRADQKEYIISSKLTVIGSLEMASVRLVGWFAPAVGAQINHHHDGYYLHRGDIIPKLNARAIESPTLLHDGDIIEVGRVRLKFSQPESKPPSMPQTAY